MRRKVEELENNNEASKKQIKELQEKLKQSTGKQPTTSKLPTFLSKATAADKESEKKLKDLEKTITDLKKQILEKDKAMERLQAAAKGKTKYITHES